MDSANGPFRNSILMLGSNTAHGEELFFVFERVGDFFFRENPSISMILFDADSTLNGFTFKLSLGSKCVLTIKRNLVSDKDFA